MKKEYSNFTLQVLEDRIVISTKEPMWETHIMATSQMYYLLSNMAQDPELDEYLSNWILCAYLHCSNIFDNQYFAEMVERFDANIKRLPILLNTEEDNEKILDEERKMESLRQAAISEAQKEAEKE